MGRALKVVLVGGHLLRTTCIRAVVRHAHKKLAWNYDGRWAKKNQTGAKRSPDALTARGDPPENITPCTRRWAVVGCRRGSSFKHRLLLSPSLGFGVRLRDFPPGLGDLSKNEFALIENKVPSPEYHCVGAPVSTESSAQRASAAGIWVRPAISVATSHKSGAGTGSPFVPHCPQGLKGKKNQVMI